VTLADVRAPGAALMVGLVTVGGLLIVGGAAVLIWTVVPYRHVRDPMIDGVLAIVLGEAPVDRRSPDITR
jgi:hypothetical protein